MRVSKALGGCELMFRNSVNARARLYFYKGQLLLWYNMGTGQDWAKCFSLDGISVRFHSICRSILIKS